MLVIGALVNECLGSRAKLRISADEGISVARFLKGNDGKCINVSAFRGNGAVGSLKGIFVKGVGIGHAVA